MAFQDVLRKTVKWLEQDKRIAYTAIKRQFSIDDNYLNDLRKAIIYTFPQFVEDDGHGLIWTSESKLPESEDNNGKIKTARFHALLPIVMIVLQREKRVTYSALKFIFGIDDELLKVLCKELIFKKIVRDQQGEGLVWIGDVQESGNSLGIPPLSINASESNRLIANDQTIIIPNSNANERQGGNIAIPGSPLTIPQVSERRNLTVMFCDIAESTKLSGQLDPEDLREIIRAYQATAAGVIQRFESYIAQYLGDGLLVYFGWPQAHEYDTQRAVYSGLGIIDAISKSLNAELEAEKGIRLDVRIGIHTGQVVVGEMCSQDRCDPIATGETVNIAARMQGIAALNSVVVSNTTAKLIKEAFDLEDLGFQTLKGVTEPVKVFRVKGAIERYEIKNKHSSDEAPLLVGRDEEIGLLKRRWKQSKEGAGQVVFIAGEAGIGKSALVEGLYAQLAEQVSARITFRCSQFHRNSAFYPIISTIEHVFGFTRDDTTDIKVGKMERVIQKSGLPMQEAMPLLAELLSVDVPKSRYRVANKSPQRQRQQTQDLLVAWLQEESEQQPMLVVWEDLHWADASTLELLELFVNQAPTVKMLHVLTSRPDLNPPWPHRSHITPIIINRLEKKQVEALIRHLTKGVELPPEVVEHIVTKTDGVPLYVEELTKTVLESKLLQKKAGRYVLTGPLSKVAIPTTLHDSLMARLDRVPIAKEVAQFGAVLGREFLYEMVHALASIEESKLLEGLNRLIENELLYQRGRPPRATYIFKHALVHEAAYRSLLRKTRRKYHQAAAELIEKQFTLLAQTEPEIIAHHYSEADCPEKAIQFWHQAGDRARYRSANMEAIAHLKKALNSLSTLPETAERTEKELDLLLAMGPALIAIEGYAAHEVERIYSLARSLCRKMGKTTQLFQTLWGLWGFYLVRANHKKAYEVGTELLELANDSQDVIYRIESHLTMGGALYCLAKFVPAREHLEKGAALYDPNQHRSHTSLFAADLGVFCMVWSSHPLWHIGFPEQALTKSREAVKLAEEFAHPFSLALALDYAAIFHQFRREAEPAQQRAEAAINICKEHKFSYYLGWATIIKGWAIAELGDCEDGINEIKQGLEILRDTGAKRSLPYYLSLLAMVYFKDGRSEKGLQIISDAFEEGNKIGEYWWKAELYRLNGNLLLQQSQLNVMKAKDSFLKALNIARHQGSLMLELRAATSLYRLCQQQGMRGEESGSLADVYNRFTEGFDTYDLMNARGLIDEMQKDRNGNTNQSRH